MRVFFESHWKWQFATARNEKAKSTVIDLASLVFAASRIYFRALPLPANARGLLKIEVFNS
jgi:hypothetical protein